MSISKTKNGTYRLRIYIPEEVKSSLGIDKKVIEKRFKLRSEAKKYELELQNFKRRFNLIGNKWFNPLFRFLSQYLVGIL